MWVVTEELPIVSVSVMIPPDALTVTTEKSEYGYFVLNWMALSHKHRFADFTDAAEIAAFYSRAEGQNIAVDYTLAKNVKKPAGGKPGFVIYHTNWTAYVTPDKEKIAAMRQK